MIITTYLSDNIKIKRKKPKLKFDILECLAIRGKLSKSGLKVLLKDRYYADISHSVDELLNGQFIEFVSRKHGRGKEQIYFRITEKGLKAFLIDGDFPAPRFWKIVYEFCLNNNEFVTLQKIDEYYKIVIGRHFKYPNRGFASQLDNFYYVCNKWLKEAVIKSKEITYVQAIIETLAVRPKISPEELAQAIIKIISVDPNMSSERLDELMDITLLDKYTERDYITNIIIKNLIIGHHDDGRVTYESSLFGAMLCLVLIHYNGTGKLKCGLYFKEYSPEQYYDKIASNYKTKLPLIFGKWNYLRRVLKVLAIYRLDTILNRDGITNHNQNSPSVVLGGAKELCDGIQTILSHNARFMVDFAVGGQEFIEKIIGRDPSNPPDAKIEPVLAKLKEVKMLLIHMHYSFPNDSDTNRKMDQLLPPKTFLEMRHTKEIYKKMEESFAEELTALLLYTT